MLSALNRLIVLVSSRPLPFIVTTAAGFGSLFTLMQIGERFKALTGGVDVFDLQNALTAPQVLEQLPFYIGAARQQYFIFSAVDFLFPFAMGLFLAGVLAFCLRHSLPRVYAALNTRNLLPLLMLGTLFDWTENVSALTAIQAWPEVGMGLAWALVTAKRLKLACVILSQGAALVLLIVTAAKLLMRKRG